MKYLNVPYLKLPDAGETHRGIELEDGNGLFLQQGSTPEAGELALTTRPGERYKQPVVAAPNTLVTSMDSMLRRSSNTWDIVCQCHAIKCSIVLIRAIGQQFYPMPSSNHQIRCGCGLRFTATTCAGMHSRRSGSLLDDGDQKRWATMINDGLEKG